jgi:hypothetical protein
LDAIDTMTEQEARECLDVLDDLKIVLMRLKEKIEGPLPKPELHLVGSRRVPNAT